MADMMVLRMAAKLVVLKAGRLVDMMV